MSHLFYVMTMPGLETIAFSEIREQNPDAELVKFARGIALFRTTATPEKLLELRTAEDVFFALAHVKGLGHGPDALRVLHSATLNADIPSALKQWRRVHGGAPPETWRVVSQKSGSHDFRRVDAGRAITNALQKALPHAMHQVKDDADMEIWLWLSGSELLIGVRLSDATMRHRDYKREHLPASLRPTIAAAMSRLSKPTDKDIVLDPLCGTGTLLVERALMAPFDRIIADVVATIRPWDARTLPLDDASVTRILTNLPFGKQVGSHETNEELYTALIQELGRVLASGGLMVSLTSEDRLWNAVLQDAGWKILKKVVLVVLGLPASIFVTERAL
jgi:tRNA (guanine6-N2)-methyltransferase